MVLVSFLSNRLVKALHQITAADITPDQAFCYSFVTLMAVCETGKDTASYLRAVWRTMTSKSNKLL